MSMNANQDSVVRYLVQYQEHLLMEDTDESAGLVDERINVGEDGVSDFDSFIFDEIPSYGNIDPTHSPFCFSEHKTWSFADSVHDDSAVNVSNEGGSINRPVHHEEHPYAKPAGKSSRRGRPEKVTSTSSSVHYSRKYRQRQKNEVLTCKAELGRLTEENKFLCAENRRLTARFSRLNESVDGVGNMVDGHACTCRDTLPTLHFCGFSNDKDSTDDVSDVRSSIPH
ncbi:unnamed protein product [Angiostrongylus costaricensis]|uniref:BZIP domain-containing protein n=1 Tax=Angiostrongylus costaricensis TaxID=334426 RepID=A0A0R3PU52_ANGCS|nr:unnamed protein product [Angiostrongylus costaricensis]